MKESVHTVWPDDFNWFFGFQRVAGADLVTGEHSDEVYVLLLKQWGRMRGVRKTSIYKKSEAYKITKLDSFLFLMETVWPKKLKLC